MKLSYYSMLHPTVTNNNHLTCYFSLSITQYNCHRRFACSLHFLNPSEFRNDSSLLKSFHIEKGTEISALLYIREIGEMMKGVIMAVMQAEQLKLDGNLWFLKNRFDAAIEAYTEAITLCPDVANYWTSRALCHRKRNDWIRVEEDCKKAIQLDHNSVKAHYMLGLALIHRKNYREGIKALEKSLDLARGAHPHKYMVEEIWQELARAKYQQWEQDSIQRSWDLQNLKSDIEIAILENHSQVEGFTDEITDSVSRKLQALNSVFSKASQSDTPTEIPDYLCCRITIDIFRDPVIAPSGLTYERAVILKHLDKVGMFDPITRQPLDPSQLVPNMAIKEAVRAFLETHGWAYRID